MKIALLNDTHFGCRNDSPAFINYQNRFYDELFIPYIIENKIDTLSIYVGKFLPKEKYNELPENFSNIVLKQSERKWDVNGKIDLAKKEEERKSKRQTKIEIEKAQKKWNKYCS